MLKSFSLLLLFSVMNYVGLKGRINKWNGLKVELCVHAAQASNLSSVQIQTEKPKKKKDCSSIYSIAFNCAKWLHRAHTVISFMIMGFNGSAIISLFINRENIQLYILTNFWNADSARAHTEWEQIHQKIAFILNFPYFVVFFSVDSLIFVFRFLNRWNTSLNSSGFFFPILYLSFSDSFRCSSVFRSFPKNLTPEKRWGKNIRIIWMKSNQNCLYVAISSKSLPQKRSAPKWTYHV